MAGIGLTMDDYQLWPHGFAAIATLRAARPALRVIFKAPCNLDAVAKATKANAGHLKIALRTLTALEWVCKDAAGVYSTTDALMTMAEDKLIDELCEDVYGEKDVGTHFSLPRLAKWLECVQGKWSDLPEVASKIPLFPHMLTGALIAPMLLELRANTGPDGSVLLSGKKTTIWALGGFFAAQGWGTFNASTNRAPPPPPPPLSEAHAAVRDRQVLGGSARVVGAQWRAAWCHVAAEARSRPRAMRHCRTTHAHARRVPTRRPHLCRVGQVFRRALGGVWRGALVPPHVLQAGHSAVRDAQGALLARRQGARHPPGPHPPDPHPTTHPKPSPSRHHHVTIVPPRAGRAAPPHASQLPRARRCMLPHAPPPRRRYHDRLCCRRCRRCGSSCWLRWGSLGRRGRGRRSRWTPHPHPSPLTPHPRLAGARGAREPRAQRYRLGLHAQALL